MRFLCLVMMLLGSFLYGASLTESSKDGSIHWDTGKLDISGKPLKLVQSVRVDPETALGTMMLFDPLLVQELQTYFNTHPNPILWGKDGISEILAGKLMNPEYRPSKKSSSLILIDASKTGFYPCLFPEIADADGTLLVSSFKNRKAIYFFSDSEAAFRVFDKKTTVILKAERSEKPFHGRLILNRDNIDKGMFENAIIGVIL